MNRRNAILAGSALAATSLLSFSGCESSVGPTSGVTRNGLKPGLQAPNISGPDLDGNPMTLGEFKGNVVLLEFWSPT